MFPIHPLRAAALSTLATVIAVGLAGTSAPAARAASACPAPTTSDLHAYITTFVSEIPGTSEGRYTAPGASAATFTQGFFKALANDPHPELANDVLNKVNYCAFRFRHVAGSTTEYFTVVQELKPRTRGWGLYVVRQTNPVRNVVIEVPHPCPADGSRCSGGDYLTDDLGYSAAMSGRARYLFIAGAQRKASTNSDVAHRADSLFQKMHEAVVDHIDKTESRKARVAQVHAHRTAGTAAHSYVANVATHKGKPGNVVLSNGIRDKSNVAYPTQPAKNIATRLDAPATGFTAGFSVCLYREPFTGEVKNDCSGLGATDNVQGHYLTTDAVDPFGGFCGSMADPCSPGDDRGEFIHVEASSDAVMPTASIRSQLASRLGTEISK